jgi:hypothetical protein
VFGTGTWHGRLFYAMELVEGQDVATKLREKQRFSPEEVLHVAEGVARALSAAWKFRIVHRDIKPSNILLTPDGSIKVADFGLAKSLRIPKTDSRLIAGTSEYISPEQGMGKAVDIRSDIYSLGVVLYELLMGRPPFKSDGSFTFVVYQHVHSVPPALEPLNGAAAIPAAVKEIIQKSLEKKPDNRFQSPEELLAAIVKARGATRPAARPGTVAGSAIFRATDWLRRARTLALILVMLAGVACAMFAVLHRTPPPPAPPGASGEVDLLLGLGDYPEALKAADRRWGKASREYQTVVLRQSESHREESELRAQEALRRRDWIAAAEAFEKAMPGAGDELGRAVKAALQLSRDLAQAEKLEENRRFEEAMSLYRRHADRAPSLKEYLRERIARVQQAADQASKKK